jgi:hypothetical protein
MTRSTPTVADVLGRMADELAERVEEHNRAEVRNDLGQIVRNAGLKPLLSVPVADLTRAPERYASECCGVVVAPGAGPDDIHAAETPEVSEETADLYDAYRRGDCPVCGESKPRLRRVA